MNKGEILALGVPADRVRDFQALYNRDMRKAAAHLTENPARAAISAMLPMIRRPENLRQLLTSINFMYWVENQPIRQKEAAPGATNTKDGRAEQKSDKPNHSTAIISGIREEIQDEKR